MAWIALGAAGLALAGGLVLVLREPDPDDEIESYNRMEAQRRAAREVELSGPVAIARAEATEPVLPKGEIDSTLPSLVVELGPSSITVAGRTMQAGALGMLFEDAYRRSADTQVIFQVSPDVEHGVVVDLMERAKRVGLTRMAITIADAP